MEYSLFSLLSTILRSYSKLLLVALFTLKLINLIKLPTFTLKRQKYKLPPGPKPWPIIGNLPEMFLNKPVPKWMHKFMKNLDTEIACFKFGNVHVIAVTSPAIACEFLKIQDDVFASRPISMPSNLVRRGKKNLIGIFNGVIDMKSKFSKTIKIRGKEMKDLINGIALEE